MAKKQLISTAFDEINKDLSQQEAYFLHKTASNEWVSKTGIYKLHAVMLAATIGFAKLITQEEVEAMVEQLSEITDAQKAARDLMSQKERLATLRLKDMFDTLQKKGKLSYDYHNHLMKVNNFHKYVPFGSAKPSIIIDSIVNGMEEYPNHPFWNEYLLENASEIRTLLINAQTTAEKSKKPDFLLQNLNFLKLKQIIFKENF